LTLQHRRPSVAVVEVVHDLVDVHG
jgi:hypothetical protein